MSERIVDPARQGESNVGARQALDAPEMSYQEAVEYHEKFDWKTIRGKHDRAREAMVAEVERLKAENDILRDEAASDGKHRRLLRVEVERLKGMLIRGPDYDATATREVESLRAALPALIACVHDEGVSCSRHEWVVCCAIRLRLIKAGIIAAPEKRDEPGDGA